jgi:hypothetical protein
MVAGARHIDPLDVIARGAADLDLAPIPAVELELARYDDDLDLAARLGGAALLDGPSRVDQRPGDDQRRQCADCNPAGIARRRR